MLRGMHNAWLVLEADIWIMSGKYRRYTNLYHLPSLSYLIRFYHHITRALLITSGASRKQKFPLDYENVG